MDEKKSYECFCGFLFGKSQLVTGSQLLCGDGTILTDARLCTVLVRPYGRSYDTQECLATYWYARTILTDARLGTVLVRLYDTHQCFSMYWYARTDTYCYARTVLTTHRLSDATYWYDRTILTDAWLRTGTVAAQ